MKKVLLTDKAKSDIKEINYNKQKNMEKFEFIQNKQVIIDYWDGLITRDDELKSKLTKLNL